MKDTRFKRQRTAWPCYYDILERWSLGNNSRNQVRVCVGCRWWEVWTAVGHRVIPGSSSGWISWLRWWLPCVKLWRTEQKNIEADHISVQFSCLVVSDSLRPHEAQHARPPCPSSTPRVHPNPCPLSRWCHPTISSSVIPFSSCPQSFPASGCFQMSQLFTSCGQRTGVSASTSVLPVNTQDWSPLGWTGWPYVNEDSSTNKIATWCLLSCMAWVWDIMLVSVFFCHA